MNTSPVYYGYNFLGHLHVSRNHADFSFPNNQIRIHHFSSAGHEGVPPMAILKIAGSGSAILCTLESPEPVPQHIAEIHGSCIDRLKTAVIVVNDKEIHMVAMASRVKRIPLFWCFSINRGVYESCQRMIRNRTLGVIFDLDETLVASNSASDLVGKIKKLEVNVAKEMDSTKKQDLEAELAALKSDRKLLESYSAKDEVVVNGRKIKSVQEKVPGQGSRPVIRLPSTNMVLTRININNPDTSMLVRIRPGWETLRSSFTSSTAKRFEVFVCTKSTRDYALEIWRILDPEYHLIEVKDLESRVVSVPGDIKKSLARVFEGGQCLSKLAMIVDDRVDVWEMKDKPRVQTVPPYLPLTANLAEDLSKVKDKCRNFRDVFFRSFHALVIACSAITYEDDENEMPPSPGVNYVQAL